MAKYTEYKSSGDNSMANILGLLQAMKCSVKFFAETMDIAPGTVRRLFLKWDRQELYKPATHTNHKIAKYLGIKIDELIHGRLTYLNIQ
jgi:hypothetical protein